MSHATGRLLRPGVFPGTCSSFNTPVNKSPVFRSTKRCCASIRRSAGLAVWIEAGGDTGAGEGFLPQATINTNEPIIHAARVIIVLRGYIDRPLVYPHTHGSPIWHASETGARQTSRSIPSLISTDPCSHGHSSFFRRLHYKPTGQGFSQQKHQQKINLSHVRVSLNA